MKPSGFEACAPSQTPLQSAGTELLFPMAHLHRCLYVGL